MQSWQQAQAGGLVRVLEATTPAEGLALEAKARVLAQLRHPGVVDLVAAGPARGGPWQLRTRWVGEPLSRLGREPDPSEIAGLGAAVANVVGDLHALGWVHGSICAEHILLDADGRPVLCGIGSARATLDPAAQRKDAADLVAALGTLVPPGVASGEWRRLRSAMRPTHRRGLAVATLAQSLASPRLRPQLPVPAGDGGARSAVLVQSRPDVAEMGWAPGHGASPAVGTDMQLSGQPEPPVADLPVGRASGPLSEEAGEDTHGAVRDRPWSDGRSASGPAKPGPLADGGPLTERGRLAKRGPLARCGLAATRGRSGWTQAVRLALALASLAALAVLVSPTLHHQAHRSVTCPAVDDGCRALDLPGGVLASALGRFAVGSPGDRVVVGRWDCGPVGLPAVLDPTNQGVWVFDRWPTPGTDVAGRSLGRVVQALSLAVAPGRSGCDALVVLRKGMGAVVLHPEAAG